MGSLAQTLFLPSLAVLPGGGFFMGAQRGDPSGIQYSPYAQNDEVPIRRRVEPFALAETYVNLGLFRDGYMNSSMPRLARMGLDNLGRRHITALVSTGLRKSHAQNVEPHCDDSRHFTRFAEIQNLDDQGHLVNHGLFEIKPRLDEFAQLVSDPGDVIKSINLYDALGFLHWMNAENPIIGTRIEMGGKVFVLGPWRLMTETEWEYAARGPSGTNEYPVPLQNVLSPSLLTDRPAVKWPRGFKLVFDFLSQKWMLTKGAKIYNMVGEALEWTETRYADRLSDEVYGPRLGPWQVLRGSSPSVEYLLYEARSSKRSSDFPFMREDFYSVRLAASLISAQPG